MSTTILILVGLFIVVMSWLAIALERRQARRMFETGFIAGWKAHVGLSAHVFIGDDN